MLQYRISVYFTEACVQHIYETRMSCVFPETPKVQHALQGSAEAVATKPRGRSQGYRLAALKVYSRNPRLQRMKQVALACTRNNNRHRRFPATCHSNAGDDDSIPLLGM